MIAFQTDAVAKKFASYPNKAKQRLLYLRELIFQTAQATDGVGALEETLKWGEPSYLTTASKSGTTIRVDWKAKDPDCVGVYFNCKTTLISTIRELYGDYLTLVGNRCILLDINDNLSDLEPILVDCMALALTYHQRKK